MQITALVAQTRPRKHLGERVNIFVDEKFAFALDIRLVEKYHLRKGLVLSDEFRLQLLREDGDAKATYRALHFLGYRARSEAEIRTRLQRDEWPEDVIERVILRLREQNFLNDEKFAEMWVENRSNFRPRGARMLQQELRQKGVDRETIEAALPDEDAEQENALLALRKLLRSKERAWKDLEERKQQEKAIQFLMRRGFQFSIAKAAWTQVKEEDLW